VVATWLQLRVARDAQVTERFTRAVDQLGSSQADVRLGGIYALERIGRDSAADRGAVIEVLAAFVRQRAPWSPDASTGAPTGDSVGDTVPTVVAWLRKRAPDVQAAMVVLGRAYWRDRSVELQLNDTDLRRAYLPRVDLQNAYLPGVHLEGSKLGGAVLRDAYLGHGYLQDTSLRDADLTGIRLHDACLDRADLRGARLDGANFQLRAGQQATSLAGADLRGARLGGANLSGAELRGANADASTIWPSGFDPVAAGVVLDEALYGEQLERAPEVRRRHRLLTRRARQRRA
jgi:hypothetical protein